MADKNNTDLEKELEAAKQREAELQERLEDLKAQKELSSKAAITKRVTVKVDKKDYEIIGNARVGGLGKSQIYTKEELQKAENREVLEHLIKKGSGLIRPI